MFEQAARMKLRFDTGRGSLSVEDLWDLPLTSTRTTSLDDIAIDLSNRLKHDTVSFVDDEQKPDAAMQLRFEIVKHVIAVRKAENKAALEAHDRAETKQKLRAILARKKDEALESMSAEEIEAMIGGL